MNQTLQGYRTLLARHPRNPILAHTRVDLPLDATASVDIHERMRRELPDVPPLKG